MLLSTRVVTLLIILANYVRCSRGGGPANFVCSCLMMPANGLVIVLTRVLGNGCKLTVVTVAVVIHLTVVPLGFDRVGGAVMRRRGVGCVGPRLRSVRFHRGGTRSPRRGTTISRRVVTLCGRGGVDVANNINYLPVLVRVPVFATVCRTIGLAPRVSRDAFLNVGLNIDDPLLTVLTNITCIVRNCISAVNVPRRAGSRVGSVVLVGPVVVLVFS